MTEFQLVESIVLSSRYSNDGYEDSYGDSYEDSYEDSYNGYEGSCEALLIASFAVFMPIFHHGELRCIALAVSAVASIVCPIQGHRGC